MSGGSSALPGSGNDGTPGQAYEVGDRVRVTGTVTGTNRKYDWVNIDAGGSQFTFSGVSASPDIEHLAPPGQASAGQAALQPVDSVYLYHWRFVAGEEFGLYRHKADADAAVAARTAEHPGEGHFAVLSMAVLDRPQPHAALVVREADEAPGVLLSDYLRDRGRPAVAAMIEDAEAGRVTGQRNRCSETADKLREMLDIFTETVINVSDRPALTALARDVRKRAELDPP